MVKSSRFTGWLSLSKSFCWNVAK